MPGSGLPTGRDTPEPGRDPARRTGGQDEFARFVPHRFIP